MAETPEDPSVEALADAVATNLITTPRFESLKLVNFLSYKSATLSFSDLVALVGPNASGKSNAVAAIKLLREIPVHGLPTAIARRGGFDQLRHRSSGHPYNPALRLTFRMPGAPASSHYELRLSAVKGKRYEVGSESGRVVFPDSEIWWFESDGHRVRESSFTGAPESERLVPVAPGQSAMSTGGLAAYVINQVLQRMQTVEVNPARVGDLQEPSSTREFEPDGSNTTGVFESLGLAARSELVDELSAIVPGIARIEVRNFADRQTLAFFQQTKTGTREFYAKQVSDGTLRAFSILLAMLQPSHPQLLVIEEPEIAIHLGALRTLVDVLRQQSQTTQILITTHSADIIDALPVEALRVVWNDSGSSYVAEVADHTIEAVRSGLITPGQLLRSDSLDPSTVR